MPKTLLEVFNEEEPNHSHHFLNSQTTCTSGCYLLSMKKIGGVWMFKGRADLDKDYKSFRIDGEKWRGSAGETLDRLLTQYPNSEVMINTVDNS